MANEGRRGADQHNNRGPPRGRGGWDGGRGGRGGGRGWGDDRDRSPRRDERHDDFRSEDRNRGRRDDRDRSHDRARPPFDDRFGPPPRGPFPPGPPGEFGPRDGPRDPFFSDPYDRRFPPGPPGPPGPWMPPSDDPFRRDPYADPFRDPYRAGPPMAPLSVPPVIECEIFLVNSKLRDYGESIQARVKDHKIITAVSIIPEGRTSSQMTEELTTRKGLFAIFINPQNEIHHSLTLNILHGSPQEHRNMPLDDAITLVGRSFLKYVEGLREKANAAAAPAGAASAAGAAPLPRVFLPPSSEVAYLLNLLADNRALTVVELESIIKYLQERRDKLLDAERRPLITDGNHANFAKESTPSSKEKELSVQQELTNKILSIFSSAGGSIKPVLPPASAAPPPAAPAPPPPPPASTASKTGASGSSLINFDNPNVQAALDNLIQSSPNLLKNIDSKAQNSKAPMSQTSTSVSTAGQNNQRGLVDAGYGQGGYDMQQNYGAYPMQGAMQGNYQPPPPPPPPGY